jgi:hypothetical protein
MERVLFLDHIDISGKLGSFIGFIEISIPKKIRNMPVTV